MRRVQPNSAVAAALIFLAVATSARASAGATQNRERARVLLIEDRRSAIGLRLRAELLALDFEVMSLADRWPSLAARDIDAMGRSTGASAVVEIDEADGALHLWTFDHASGRASRRNDVGADGEPAVVAMRAVEALRAALYEPQSTTIDTGGAVSARAPELSPRSLPHPRPTPSFAVAVGPALAMSAGPAGASLQGFASVRWLPAPAWGVSVIGLWPVTTAVWREAEGTARMRFGIVAAGAEWNVLAGSWYVVDVSAGAGAALLHTAGSSNDGRPAETTDRWAATPFLGVGCALARSSWIGVRADVIGAVAVPRPVFVFADRAAGSWGRPLVFGALSVEVVR